MKFKALQTFTLQAGDIPITFQKGQLYECISSEISGTNIQDSTWYLLHNGKQDILLSRNIINQKFIPVEVIKEPSQEFMDLLDSL